jgi:hypothetical protein
VKTIDGHDDAGLPSGLDHVPHCEGLLGHEEEAALDIGDAGLRREAEGDSDDAGRSEQGRRLDPELPEHDDDHQDACIEDRLAGEHGGLRVQPRPRQAPHHGGEHPEEQDAPGDDYRGHEELLEAVRREQAPEVFAHQLLKVHASPASPISRSTS